MSNVAIALLSNIEASQNEIIGAIYSQVQTFVDNVVVIDFYANNKTLKVLNGEPDTLKLRQYDCDCWSKMFKKIKREMKEFDKVIIFKTPVMCNEQLVDEMLTGMQEDDSFNMQYDKMRRLYERLLFVEAISDKDVYQFVIDPREMDFSKVWDFKSYKRICTWKSDIDKYGPIYEYALVNTFVQEIPKAQDFYFGASIYDDTKEYLREVNEELNNRLGRRHKGGVWNNPFLGKSFVFDVENRDSRVGQSTYLYNLMLSRYTLIVAPYETQYFNIMRFMEAVICDCVPLIEANHNNLENLRLTFPDIYDIIIKRDLLVKYNRIYNRIHQWEVNDQYVVPEIKGTKSFKKITSKEKVQQFYNKLFGGV